LLESAGSTFSPHGLLDLAAFYAFINKGSAADEYWQQFDRHRGTILSFWFSGVLILAWLLRAEIAVLRNDRAAVRQYAQMILDHWSRSNPSLRIVQAAGNLQRITN
jgi:hypothetical protein